MKSEAPSSQHDLSWQTKVTQVSRESGDLGTATPLCVSVHSFIVFIFSARNKRGKLNDTSNVGFILCYSMNTHSTVK